MEETLSTRIKEQAANIGYYLDILLSSHGGEKETETKCCSSSLGPLTPLDAQKGAAIRNTDEMNASHSRFVGTSNFIATLSPWSREKDSPIVTRR